MRRIRVTVLLLTGVLTCARAQEASELRAAWLTNVDSNILFTDQAISDAMDYLASINVNVVFPVVYNKGYTLYPSATMNSEFGAPVLPGSPFVGRDFLARLVIEAHRNGIEVIPWFEFGFATSYSLNGGHIIAKYPSWALKDVNGNLVVDNGFDWMSAINPGPQNFMLSLMMEVLDRYDVDGVQGDDRLPAMPVEGGYDSVTASIYRAEHSNQPPPVTNGDASWKQWRANKLTQFLSRLRDSVKARGANVILSMSPAPYYWGYDQLLQDSKSWVQQGLVDNVIPQLYQYNISDFAYALNTTWNDVGQYRPAVFSSGILANVGAYVVDTTFLGQMLSASRAKGAKGECFFFYEGLRTNGNAIGGYLKRNFYQNSAVPPYRGGKRWIAKAQIVNETDPAATVAGAWSAYAMKGYQGKIDRTSDTVNPASIQYAFTVGAAGYYDVFVYSTPNTIWTQHAVYTLTGDSAPATVIVDQTDLTRLGWQKLGTVHLAAGTSNALKIDNSQLESGRYLVTDAAMLMLNRRLSPDVVLSVKPQADPRGDRPSGFELFDNYPNPFNPTTGIRYQVTGNRGGATDVTPSLPRGGQESVANGQYPVVSLKVYDLLGREVTTLVDGPQAAGMHEARWNGTNDRGQRVASGMYLYQLRAGTDSITKKMIVLR